MRYSICLAAAAVAACSNPASNNSAANTANAANPANAATPSPAAKGANAAAPAANSAAPAAPAAPSTIYLARGTEPFWLLRIESGQMRYEPADGAPVTVTAPPQAPITGGFQYSVPGTLTARFTLAPCVEASGDSVPYTVQVFVGSSTTPLDGCGQ